MYDLVKDKSRLDPSSKCNSAQVCSINNCFTNSHCIILDVDLYSSTGKRVTITMVARVVELYNSTGKRVIITMVTRVVQDLPYKLIVGLKLYASIV